MQPHASHLGPVGPEGIPSYGNPVEFYGVALIAFVDLLGFSASIRRDWSTDTGSTLGKLVRIKDGAQRWQRTQIIRVKEDIIPPPPETIFQSRVHTVSDSIFVANALQSPNPLPADVYLSIGALFGGVGYIWEQAVIEGFTVRGAIEIGQIYWTPSETVGPAFLDCYEYESTLANWSRVIIGPRLLELVSSLPQNDDPLTNFLALSQDGLIELAPLRLQLEERKTQLQDIRAAAGPKHRKKYDPLLAQLSKGSWGLESAELVRAHSRTMQRIARKRRWRALFRRFC